MALFNTVSFYLLRRISLILVLFCAVLHSESALSQKVSEKVLQIWSVSKKGAGTGTGFFVNDQGYIVTNHHVIDGGKRFYAVPDGLVAGVEAVKKNYKVDLVWASADLDLAILKPQKETLEVLKISPVDITNNLPLKGENVRAVGFPGVADSKTLKSADIKAEATISSGVLGRLVSDGVWRKGGPPLRLVQHSAFIHRGNSGGPLFDACDRVIGVNTQGEVNIVKDSKGRGTGIGDLIAGFYYASDSRELIDALDRQGVSYYLDDSKCISKQDQTIIQTEEITKTLRLSLYLGGIALIVIAGMFIYLLRSPGARQRVSHAVETYSRSIRSSRPKSENQNPAPVNRASPPTTAAAAKTSLILDGYGSDRQRYRLVISADELYGSEVVVGRDPDNRTYAINDSSVSRRHCVFYAQGNNLYIREINSTNGTFVDGRKLAEGESVSLRNGSDIKLGSVTLKVIAG